MRDLFLFKKLKTIAFLVFSILWTNTGNSQTTGYLLEWNGQRINFSSVSGLGETTQTSIYQNRTLIRVNALTTSSVKTATLQKIRCRSDNELYKWFCSFSDPTRQKRDIVIKLLNMNGEIIKAWKIYQASPSKMDVPPAMDADANDVVIETLVLTYERVEPDL